MKLGWKVIGFAILIAVVGSIANSFEIMMVGGIGFWVGVALLFTNIRSRPKKGVGSGKL